MQILLFLLFLTGPLFARAPVSHSIEECRPLRELLLLFGIPSDQAAEETGRRWLPTGKERWEFDSRSEEIRALAWPLFEEMGLFDEIEPTRSRYDYALILGALLGRVEQRIGYLKELLDRGISVGRIVFLSGDRPLLGEEREKTGLASEIEMVRWIYERSDLPKSIPVDFVDAPKRGRRPQTSDTAIEWLKSGPLPGSCLAISNLLDTIAKELFWRKPCGYFCSSVY